MIGLQAITFAFLGGLLPALLWLWFWLKEDSKSPEPRSLILLAFVAGMIAVPLAIPLERYAETVATGGAVLVLWSVIEEVLKYAAALIAVLWRRAVDEPIDPVIYMITVAIGFAALENTLFLLSPLLEGDVVTGILTGNLRFLGATLLHTLASAIIGIALALSFYKRTAVKWVYAAGGVILAVLLHAVFNSFIMKSNGESILSIFFAVWIGIIAIIFLFEKVKHIRKPVFVKKK
jgi:RsiW-degrading membrane proteinase PrsW (M82 family)